VPHLPRPCGVTALAVLAAGACANPRPATSVSASAERPVLIGTPISASGSWNDTCEDVAGTIFSKSGGTKHTTCHERAFTFEVACAPRCGLPDGDHVAPGKSTELHVIPLELGPLTIATTSTRADNGQVHHGRTTVIVAPPDHLELACADAKGTLTPCGPDGVAADRPQLEARAVLDGRDTPTIALRANGASLPAAKFSLVDLFPAQRVGDGAIAPGTYEVTLTLGDVSSRWQLVAR
jgi:hypothetical protein